MSPGEWTNSRVSLLRAEYPRAMDNAALLAAINALPGRPIRSVCSMQDKARDIGCFKAPDVTYALRVAGAQQTHAARKAKALPVDLSHPRPLFVEPLPDAPDLSPEEQAAVADAAVARKQARARAMLGKKACPHAVAANVRLPLREVFRLIGEMRA